MSEQQGRPAHIAMFNIAAHGHVNPGLGIVRELVRRGHRVTYAVPAPFAELVADAGAEPRVYRSILPGDNDDPSEWGARLMDVVEKFLEEAIQALPQLIDAYEGGSRGSEGLPGLVLADTASYPGRVLAHRWGVPHVQLSAHMAPWAGHEEESDEDAVRQMSTPRGVAYSGRFTGWLTDNGITLHPDDFAGRPERSLVLIPKALQPHADRVDTGVYTFVGNCQGDRGHQGEWTRPEGAEGKRVLLVSLGSAFTDEPDFYRSCLAAFGGLPGWHVVLQSGKHVGAEDLGPLPGNVEVHDWVPQLSVLRQADAFVTHAGAGGSQEGLATATPMIAVPQAADQFGNAEVLERLGVARRLPKEEATAEALRAALDALVDEPEVAAACAAAAASVAAEGGVTSAADRIERWLREAAGPEAGAGDAPTAETPPRSEALDRTGHGG